MSEVFVKKINDFANDIGWSIQQQDPEVLFLNFDMGDGRSQAVMIFYHQVQEAAVVAISSAVLKMDGMPEGKIGSEMAMKLLRENNKMGFANWAIDGEGQEAHLVATSRWWLDDLDKEEFFISVTSVARMADDMEKSLGVDNF